MNSVHRDVSRYTASIRNTCSALLLVAEILLTAVANSQPLNGPSPPGYREYVSILGTPIGSLPPLATYTLTGIAQHTPELLARYGFISDMALPLAPDSGGHQAHSLNSFALTGVMPFDLGGTLSLTAGLSAEHCDGCSGARFMAAADGDYRLFSTGVDAANATRFTLAVTGEAGIGHPATGTTFTLDVGLPAAFTLGSPTGTQYIPFLTPSFAFVSTSSSTAGDAVSAGRALVGAGIMFFNAKSSLGGSIGFQYIFVDKTQVSIGVTLSYGGR